MINKIKVKCTLWSLFSLILCLGTTYEMKAQKQQITQQQIKANRQIIESQKYKPYYSLNTVKQTPFKNYQQLIVHDNGYITTLEPSETVQRIIRYDLEGNKVWETELTGYESYGIGASSNNGKLIGLWGSREGNPEREFVAIYDSLGHKIPIGQNLTQNIQISPSGNYFYETHTKYGITSFEIYSSRGIPINFPFEQLLSLDQKTYDYSAGMRIFENDVTIVQLEEYIPNTPDKGYENKLNRALFYVISLKDKNVLFTYDLKINDPKMNRRAIGLSLNNIFLKEGHIFFQTIGTGKYGGYYGYNIDTEKEIYQQQEGKYPLIISEDNKYFLRSLGSWTYSISDIKTGSTIIKFKYEKRGRPVSFRVLPNNKIICRYELSGSPPISAIQSLLYLTTKTGQPEFELNGWFPSINTGYTTDGTQYYQIKRQGD